MHITDGEITVPLTKDELQESNLAGDISEVITGEIPARTSGSEVTLFDSTGIALRNSATLLTSVVPQIGGISS